MADGSSRDLRAAPAVITPTGYVDRWALLVGISQYADEGLSLRFAARDASRLETVLLEPRAGAFAADHVLALVDEQATLANLTRALRTFLKRPARDDLVVLFFACHGSRDRDRPDNLYLLPHDTDPADISGTGLPMREVELALRETLLSRRVVVLVDTCHSGGMGDSFADLRAFGDDAADLNSYLGALSQSRGGVSLMTSAMASESSEEREEWGGGHGVFTHFLLEGVRGRADEPPYDGVITVGELFDFVERQVKEATGGRQHPHISAGADRSLVLAVTGSLSVNEHRELAVRLAAAADLLGEATCWRGAAVQLAEEGRLRGPAVGTAHGVEHALALYRSGDASGAERALRALPAGDQRVRTTLGLLRVAQGKLDEGKATLQGSEPLGAWVPALFSTEVQAGRRSALLVGLNHIDPASYAGWDGALKGPVAEVDALAEALDAEFGFDEVVRLVDHEATSSAIVGSLTKLVERAASSEALVVFLAGHGGQVPVPEAEHALESTFVAYDRQILAEEVDRLLGRSVAERTTFVGTMANGLIPRAAEHGYDVIAPCAAGEFDMDASPLGPFVTALLPNLKSGVSAGRVAEATQQALATAAVNQHPQFVLDLALPLFVGNAEGDMSGTGASTLAAALLGVTAATGDRTLERIAAFAARPDIASTMAGEIALEARRRDRHSSPDCRSLPIQPALRLPVRQPGPRRVARSV